MSRAGRSLQTINPGQYLWIGLAILAVFVFFLLVGGVLFAVNKPPYDLIKDLLVPLIGPLVAVLIPVLVLYIIPLNQSRQRLALDLISQYFTEEMRHARNMGWRHFVIDKRQLAPIRQAEHLNHFMEYLTEPSIYRAVDPVTDELYQRSCRVLDYFVLVNGCLARKTIDPGIVRDCLIFYYRLWLEEIIIPLRHTHRATATDAVYRPLWWEPLKNLDRLL